MTTPLACFCALALGAGVELEPEHAANSVYKALLADGFHAGATAVPFAPPVFHDGQSAEAQRAALRQVAGSDAKAEDLLRDSITAPFVLKIRDLPAGGQAIVRAADLWFVVHADLDAIDPDEVSRGLSKGEPVEAGNMRFTPATVGVRDLKARGIEPPGSAGDKFPRAWYVHLTGRLLDRIGVEATDRVVTTRSAESLVVASRTAEEFRAEGPDPNRWWPIRRSAGRDEAGASHPYDGGAGYVKISRLKSRPGALLVEAHVAFVEPRAWFDGAPILRSKLGLVAQDQIRTLRRELTRRRK
jgi:hypothetical protein